MNMYDIRRFQSSAPIGQAFDACYVKFIQTHGERILAVNETRLSPAEYQALCQHVADILKLGSTMTRVSKHTGQNS
ncbi:hypothetical protein [Pseudobacteriovorax antillogorgiicola]|uniref:Uncharacterized protein n=1 Tax=Pseudobacteriovorax antillogorgiicola TaxID=1513793 RepID=A0A1Y6C495_9BACT|nr:hypothetical protein [Pseudobacteriovorax antillogorgiicola]TCS49894.1 hypothetical protein EDD56_114139 [Pseudobacteriovorax antillogorgiicola]SMF44689.1 hypothetical protein SAMN06296036_113144 [Pseudobacteriovorax antillogorgiicola]